MYHKITFLSIIFALSLTTVQAQSPGCDCWTGAMNPVGILTRYKNYMDPAAPSYEAVKPVPSPFIVSEVKETIYDGGVVSIYPNPASEIVVISGLSAQEPISIFDGNLREVHTTEAGYDGTCRIIVSDWNSGVYYLTGSVGGISRFVVQK